MNRASSLISGRLVRALACASLSLSLAAPAQITAANDPANLAGERVAPQDLADTLPINHGALALQQLLRKLRTRASFMLIVAHPDDEDGGLLTYLSRGQGARVAMLTLNRGEGGQNLMSADFDDALGLIRTQELLAADRYMGVDQFFGTEVDFGFSKTKEEAFSKWGHDRVLYDAVRAIRLYRPLVIASVFIGAPSDGHGQHQVSGEIAQEAFKAAGDPNVFPDQIAAGLQPWQPLKVYARSPFARIDAQGMYDYAVSAYVPPRFTNYVTGKVTNTVPKANVTIPEGDTDPLLGGLSYVQFARQGLALQKSQIGQNVRLAAPGRADVSYHRYGSKLGQPDGDDSGLEPSLFDGIDTTLPGIATLAPEVSDKFRPFLVKIDQQIAEAQRIFDPAKPELTAPPLRNALMGVDTFILELENSAVNDLPLTESVNLLHELRIKRVQLNNALVLALGLTVRAETIHETGDVVLNSKPTIAAQLEASIKGVNPPRLREVVFTGPNETIKQPLNDNPPDVDCGVPRPDSPDKVTGGWITGVGHEIKPGLNPTRPYFSRPNIEQPYYDISDPSLRDAPMTPPPFIVQTEFTCNGVPLFVNATISKHSDSQSITPVLAVPPVSIRLDRGNAIVIPEQKTVHVVATLRGDAAGPRFGDGLGLFLERDHATKQKLRSFILPIDDLVGNEDGKIGISTDAAPFREKTATLAAMVSMDSHTYSEGYRPVGYGDLPRTNFFRPSSLRVVPIDVHTAPNLKVAYLRGTGDDVPAYLPDLGVTPTILTVADITPATLSKYDAVILGVRAYTAHPELAGPGSKPLLEYARNGGVVILQYNNGRYGDAEAPYPITTPGSSGDHAHDVVDETAPVTILAPNSPLLTWPNKITATDFNGWVAERGHAFAGTWSAEYTPLLETHDPGQPPQQGGLLFARVGKGAYIYCGLALYRQLPEGVPGAYRLLANLISASKNPGLK